MIEQMDPVGEWDAPYLCGKCDAWLGLQEVGLALR